MVERILDHDQINVFVGENFEDYRAAWREDYNHLVFTGSIVDFYQYAHGALPYRTLRFEAIRGKNIIGNAVLNYTDMSQSFTRVHEHKWFTPERKFDRSIVFKEYPSDTDSKNNPIYPIRNTSSKEMYKSYADLAKNEKDVTFVGLLAEFRYYDMHQVIAASMSIFEKKFTEVNE
jgi:UDP-galactopyranose mutase